MSKRNWNGSFTRPSTVLLTFFSVSITTSLAAFGQCSDGKAQASNSLVDYTFGTAVDISGDLAIVGKPQQSEPITKVFAYQFDSKTSTWIIESQLVPDDEMPGTGFGFPLALSNDTAVVGAPYDSQKGNLAGAVYVFRHDHVNGVWNQEAKLLASDASALAYFGGAVALDGNLIVIGASTLGGGANKAYVFRHDDLANRWNEEQIIFPPPVLYDNFGWSVACHGDIVMVWGYKSGYGDPSLEHVYVYRFEPVQSLWRKEAVLVGDQQDSLFGAAIAVHDNVAVVGSIKYCTRPPLCALSLAAHVFRYDQRTSEWVHEADLEGSNDATDVIWIANWLDVSGDEIAFGDYQDVVDGAQKGSVFLYRYDRADSKWNLDQHLFAPDGLGNNFGFVLALNNGRMVVGSPGYSENYNPSDPGSAYFFDLAGEDCNGNGICDPQDIAAGTSLDLNFNGIPDECEHIPGDVDGDGLVNLHDLLAIINAWGPCPSPPQRCAADLNGDGSISHDDLDIVLAHWSP